MLFSARCCQSYRLIICCPNQVLCLAVIVNGQIALNGKSKLSAIELQTSATGYAPVAVPVYDDHGYDSYGKHLKSYGGYGRDSDGNTICSYLLIANNSFVRIYYSEPIDTYLNPTHVMPFRNEIF